MARTRRSTSTANTPPIIAPFFADVDTRARADRDVTYGATTSAAAARSASTGSSVGYYAGAHRQD